VSTTELCETAARSLRGALQSENLREQDHEARRDLARYWWDAMRQAGLTPPKRPQYLAVLGYAQDVAGLRPALAEVA
jgi:hypothetical protein